MANEKEPLLSGSGATHPLLNISEKFYYGGRRMSEKKKLRQKLIKTHF
jgi:hypothetical protein